MKDVYNLGKLEFSEKDAKTRLDTVLGNLTLFAPLSHEEAPTETEKKFELERPITPIDEEVKRPPATFRRLAKLVRRRISAKPNMKHVSLDDQQELAAVIMGEVNSIWKDVRFQVEDPILDAEGNRELQRRITVYMVTVCEQLFLQSLKKLDILNRRGVFSTPANMSRLKAMVGLDANKFLNILTIRRYIIQDLKGGPPEATYNEPITAFTTLSFQLFLELSRPKKRRGPVFSRMSSKEIAKELNDMMPNLDPGRLAAVLEDMPKENKISATTDDLGESRRKMDTTAPRIYLETERTKSEIQTRDNMLLKRSNSLPRVAPTETLLEELGVDLARDNKYRPKSALAIPDSQTDESTIQVTDRDSPYATMLLKSQDVVAKDLRNLMHKHMIMEKEHETVDPEEIPALIQALTMSVQHDKKVAQVQDQLRELEENERKQREAETILLQQPSHPQPAVITNKLGNGLVVRTSDVRVSERVCLGSVTLQKYGSMYNEFLGEVDPKYMKKLDDGLFIHSEIDEVYQEIMKTVKADHLELDNDSIFLPTADDVNLSEALASSSLVKQPKERVINPFLRRGGQTCPWDEEDYREWLKTPTDPPLDFKGRPTIQKMVPRPKLDEWTDLLGENAEAVKRKLLQDGATANQDQTDHEGGDGEAKKPDAMEEFTARNYASWQAWWKETITTDDYLKYVAIQGSDFLGVSYHFYNSDDEDDDEHVGTSEERLLRKASRMRKQLAAEKQQRLDTLRKQKNQYVKGFWNVMAVTLGGLGKDPEIDEAIAHGTQHVPSEVLQGKAPEKSHFLGLTRAVQESGSTAQYTSVGAKASKHWPKASTVSMVHSPTANKTQHNKYRSSEKPTENGFGGQSRASRGGGGGGGKNRNMSNMEDSTIMDDLSPDSPHHKAVAHPQARFDLIWDRLEMPDEMCLQMAIKFSTEKYFHELPQALSMLEDVSDLIKKRETLMSSLETFESHASDPNRFFEKGKTGSSLKRLQESRTRAGYYKKLEHLEPHITLLCRKIKKQFGESITFRSRPYLEKMQHDRTEMLHWLQEERRLQALDYEAKKRDLPQISALHLNSLDVELLHQTDQDRNTSLLCPPQRPGFTASSQPMGKGVMWRGPLKPSDNRPGTSGNPQQESSVPKRSSPQQGLGPQK